MSQSLPQAAFPFHMLREIYEQPDAIRQTIVQHIDPASGMVCPDRFPLSLIHI